MEFFYETHQQKNPAIHHRWRRHTIGVHRWRLQVGLALEVENLMP